MLTNKELIDTLFGVCGILTISISINVLLIQLQVKTKSEPKITVKKSNKPKVAPQITDNISIDTTIKRLKPKVAPYPIEFSPEDISKMNDYELTETFIRITGCIHLSCNHCKGPAPIMPYWINSIRKRCMKSTWAGKKGGLHRDMILPATCDAQQSRNSVCNPINNATYSKLRSTKIDNNQKIEAIKNRQYALELIGLKTRPYRYTT
jgi:hypothetical protein